MPRTSVLLATSLLTATSLLGLSGCGGSGSASDGGSAGASSGTRTATPGPDGTPAIDITVKNGKITPQGAQVRVKAGAELTFHVVADASGEIHVHSSPEHEFEYTAGTTDETITLDQPGVVDVESHTLDKLVVQLEVR
ncbi:MAG: hypothetical protein JWR20_95 [Marmoricola sp.]|nr:hypothetical protein [Marmoricola sp.]